MESNRSANMGGGRPPNHGGRRGDGGRLAGGMVLGSLATVGGIYGHNAVASNGGYKKTFGQGKDFAANKAGSAFDGALDTLVKMRMKR